MTRASLLALLGFVALTSIAGGAVMAASTRPVSSSSYGTTVRRPLPQQRLASPS